MSYMWISSIVSPIGLSDFELGIVRGSVLPWSLGLKAVTHPFDRVVHSRAECYVISWFSVVAGGIFTEG